MYVYHEFRKKSTILNEKENKQYLLNFKEV